MPSGAAEGAGNVFTIVPAKVGSSALAAVVDGAVDSPTGDFEAGALESTFVSATGVESAEEDFGSTLAELLPVQPQAMTIVVAIKKEKIRVLRFEFALRR